MDKKTNAPLASASIVVNETNISTVTNDEGEFLLKVPRDITNGYITISYLGYKNVVIALSEFDGKKLKIHLSPSITNLSEVNIGQKNPIALIKAG